MQSYQGIVSEKELEYLIQFMISLSDTKPEGWTPEGVPADGAAPVDGAAPAGGSAPAAGATPAGGTAPAGVSAPVGGSEPAPEQDAGP
jgi:hypothetical protein